MARHCDFFGLGDASNVLTVGFLFSCCSCMQRRSEWGQDGQTPPGAAQRGVPKYLMQFLQIIYIHYISANDFSAPSHTQL